MILFDPIFQGLAISLMAGEVASLLLSRMTVPVIFYMSERKKYERPAVELIPAPESPEETVFAAVEPAASLTDSLPVVEPKADREPATGNEQRIDGEHDSGLERADTANGVNEDGSPDDSIA